MNNWNLRKAGEIWPDNNGIHINAHGGGILFHQNVWYWYGEHKTEGRAGNLAHVGIHVYTSQDLYHWDDAGIAFDLFAEGLKDGCILERPKVIFCRKTGKFVLYFHYEESKSYSCAAVGVALADRPEGPFKLQKISRPNVGVWPLNTPAELRDETLIAETRRQWDKMGCGENPFSPQLSILGATIDEGQESRDMTLFVDDDQTAYLVHSSEKNSTLHIVELTDDYCNYTGRYWRVFPFRWMEAPCIFKRNNLYYFLGSGCTGWAPNAARAAVAESLTGPWRELGNPAIDEGKETTYGAQSNFVLPLPDGEFLFMGDLWRPDNAIDGRYFWQILQFDAEGKVVLRRP